MDGAAASEQWAEIQRQFLGGLATGLEVAGNVLIAFDVANTIAIVTAGPDTSLLGMPMIAAAGTLRALTARGVASIATPFGKAVQSTSAAALAARAQVAEGATLWRIGTVGRSAAGEAQFWSLERPLTQGFAGRMGIPPGNVANANFIEAAVLRPGTPFVTRVAPGIGGNVGGGIEVVIPEGGVILRYFGTF